MKAFGCPACGANKLIYLPHGTMKCEYCKTEFLINDDLIPDIIVPPEFGTEVFFDNALKYLSECGTAPADIFDAEFEEVKIQFRSFRSAYYDVNLDHPKEQLDPNVKGFVPYYLLRYSYCGKAYYLGAYAIGRTKSLGTPPNVTDRINETVKKRVGRDVLGFIALIVGFALLMFDVRLLRVLSILLFAAGITLGVLHHMRSKAERQKEFIKNSEERTANYLIFINKRKKNN